jgi:hypothetical protein
MKIKFGIKMKFMKSTETSNLISKKDKELKWTYTTNLKNAPFYLSFSL